MSGATVGLYGKVTTQADFLRVNAGEFSQSGLDRWFEEALETLRSEGGHLPEGPTGFLLATAGASSAFVGAFAPGTDAVGGSFPLVVFAELASDEVSDGLPALPSACTAFVEAAGRLALEGGALTAAELAARAQALAEAGLPSLRGGAGGAPALGNEGTRELLAALGSSSRALGYALRTFALACDQAAKQGPDSNPRVITVDAPAPSVSARQLWLEVALRRLRWRRGLPSLLWREDAEGASGRMLMALGPPSQFTFAYLANQKHRSPRFWPLRTDVGAAIDQAMQTLTPEQRRLVENPGASLGELAAAFSV